MNPIYSVGIHSLWDELSHMPAGGVWWVNTERDDEAFSLVAQTLSAQHPQAQIALITMAHSGREVIEIMPDGGPDSIRLFTMNNTPKGLDFFSRDLSSRIKAKHRFFIFINANQYWQNISPEQLRDWIKNTSAWAKYNECTLLIVNPGNNSDKQFIQLINAHRYLDGLASLRQNGNFYRYDIAYWCNEKGVSAQQQLTVGRFTRGGWRVVAQEEHSPQPRSDEKQVLAHVVVLEGAPPLSENWLLYENNDALLEAARGAQAATVVFSLSKNTQIEGLAHQIHTLRRQRGTIMKIVVRENKASLRATDERLLLGCGANLIISWNAPLSRCLMLLESVQGQTFSRRVPEDISGLLDAMQPLKLRGFQQWDVFCQAVSALLGNLLLPADGKGVMVALRPTPGIRVEQALTLCRPARVGDIVTIGDGRLVLFLSFCRINDLDTALKHIFPLAIGDIFSNRRVWFEDVQIAAELAQMRDMSPEKWGKPLSGPEDVAAPVPVKHDGANWRRMPQPIALLSDAPGDATV